MGNSAPVHHTHRNLAQRVEEFKTSNEWKYIEDSLVNPLTNTVSTRGSQLATLVMLSAGRRGLMDYATLYSDMPSATVVKALLNGHQSLILSHEYAQELFGSGIGSMADFMALALDRALFDGAIEGKLDHIMVPGAVECSAETMVASLREPYASKLLKYPTVVNGLCELTEFHRRHLKGRILAKDWTWADSAHVALIVMTSIQWEQRLKREFDSELTQAVLVSLATEQVRLLEEKNEMILGRNAELRLGILRILDVSLAQA